MAEFKRPPQLADTGRGKPEILMRLFCALCLLPLFSAGAFAATVTVSMSQNSDAPSSAIEMTRVIENAIMGEYFNSGQIVSNTGIMQGEPSPSETRALVREAAAGMSDFLLSVRLEYEPNKKIVTDAGGVYALLKKAEWQVIDVASSKIVGSGSLLMEEGGTQGKKPYESARAAAAAISKESLKAQAEAEEGKR